MFSRHKECKKSTSLLLWYLILWGICELFVWYLFQSTPCICRLQCWAYKIQRNILGIFLEKLWNIFVILWHLVKYKCDIYPTKALLSKMQSPNLSPLCTMQRIIDEAIFCEYYRINYPRDETNWAKDLSLLHIMTSMFAPFSGWVYNI